MSGAGSDAGAALRAGDAAAAALRAVDPAAASGRDTGSVARRDAARGALIGLAVGDALGTTVEFTSPGSFEPVTDIVGGGPFGLEPGEWTDDTSMALCLAESLVETGGFDPLDQMRRYVRWWREGHLSVNGRCFDIGNATRAALSSFERSGDAFSGSEDSQSAGNGSLMRLAPVPMAFHHDPAAALRLAGESSRTTHGAAECVSACRYYAGLMVGAINGATKAELLAPHYSPVAGGLDGLAPGVAEVAGGSFLHREPPVVRGAGYVVRSLEAALWAFARAASFEEGALLAVNLGEDADTIGAVYGQLAGAYYGESGIPERWREVLAMRDVISRLADGLVALAG
ncbi:MAG: ADP-ribosylglycohydrolase family protein [Trueperaceae bacterium]|nr:ADP-ribosylglycohydrolase family protein [Trueperaceae bacterium]MCO5173079.1 ADP-ribosylglycohydrolase family protein [Trueperaceae bacterium]